MQSPVVSPEGLLPLPSHTPVVSPEGLEPLPSHTPVVSPEGLEPLPSHKLTGTFLLQAPISAASTGFIWKKKRMTTYVWAISGYVYKDISFRDHAQHTSTIIK